MLLKGHQPLHLSNPDLIWWVESGQVDIFAVRLQDGKPIGKRRYLFTVEPDEALFGLVPAQHPNGCYGLLAVAFGHATLQQWSFASPLTEPNRVQLIGLGQRWLEHWDTVNWNHQISALPSTFIPTTIETWSQIQTYLQQFHHHMGEMMAQQDQQDIVLKQTQVVASQHLNQETQTHAIQDLTALITPHPHSRFQSQPQRPNPQQEPLFRAIQMIGQKEGFSVIPPSSSVRSLTSHTPVEAIASASRIRFRRVIFRAGWWRRDCGPLLAFTRDTDRPVALLPMATGHYQQIDPSTGDRTVVTAESARQLQPYSYVFYRPLPDRPLRRWDMLQFAFSGRGRDLWTLTWTGIGATLLTMVTPLVMAILIDQAIPDGDRGLLFQMGLALLAASMGNALFLLAQGFAIVRLQAFSDAAAQTALWDRLLKLHLSFFRQYTTGDLHIRVSAINQMRDRLNSQVLRLLFTSLFAVLNLGLLFFYSPVLAIGVLIMGGLTVGLTAIASSINLRQLRPLFHLKGEIFGLIVQFIKGVGKLRVTRAESRALAQWTVAYTQQQQLVHSTQWITDLIQTWNTILPTISRMLIYGIAITVVAYAPEGDRLSTGSFLAFNTALGVFITAISDLSNTLMEILEAGVLWERTQPILTAEPERELSKEDPGPLTGALRLNQVSFRYSPHAPLTLNQVTLEAKPGEFIAIVGPSGSGKSTLVRLLLGFEKPLSGIVSYNGRDLADLDVTTVRQQLGVVLQRSRLLSASIFENIACGALLTMEDAWAACQKAGLADEIAAMPMGMHTIISEGGSNFSGGQRQRLLIARALALNPNILIFDEATSALDNRTQAVVSRSIEQLNVTRIVIAHRLSTIRPANRIYVLQAGRIVQQGSFDDLSQQAGLFSSLMGRQMV